MTAFLIAAALFALPDPPPMPHTIVASEVHEGVVLAALGNKLMIRDKDGENEEFVVQPETKITYNGKDSALEQLQAGDMVRVAAKKTGNKMFAVTIDARSRM